MTNYLKTKCEIPEKEKLWRQKKKNQSLTGNEGWGKAEQMEHGGFLGQ